MNSPKETTEHGETIIRRVLEHKTTSTGPANVVVTKEIGQLMHLYLVNLREKILPQSQYLSKRFF